LSLEEFLAFIFFFILSDLVSLSLVIIVKQPEHGSVELNMLTIELHQANLSKMKNKNLSFIRVHMMGCFKHVKR
jgi:hypothetical protein